MFNSHKLWLVLWNRAATDSSPFEISEVVSNVAEALEIDEKEAPRRISLFLGELQRLPEGDRYFTLEGSAVVPLPEFAASPKDEAAAMKAYPFEV
jgi:hypothetical protein